MESPLSQFKFFTYSVLGRLFASIGCGITVTGFKLNWRTYTYVALCVSGTIVTWYTILFTNYTMAMRGVTIVNLCHQGVIKLYPHMFKSDTFAVAIGFLHKIYVHCELRKGGQAVAEMSVLLTWIGHMRSMTKLYSFIIVLTIVTFFTLPLYAALTGKDNELLIPILLPGIDWETSRGLLIHWLYHVGMMFGVVAIGLVCTDLLMVLLILHSCAIADLLCLKLCTMGDTLCQLERWRRPCGDQGTRLFLHNVIRIHREYVWYIGYMADCYYLIFTAEVMSNFMTMCLCLYVMMLIQWPALYGLLALMIVKTFYVCVLGTIVEMQSDKVLMAFSNFPYYVLTRIDQKKLLLCIQIAQKPQVLFCGTIPVNMSLFVSVMKNTYSVAMLLHAMV